MSSSVTSAPTTDSITPFIPLSWIPQTPLPSTGASASSPTPYWYLGNTEISQWCTKIGTGLNKEMQADLNERVNWAVQATLENIAYLKSMMPRDLSVQIVPIEHRGKLRHLILFKNSLFFSLKPTTSGGHKTAIPMIDLQTGTPLIRLRVRHELCFPSFFEEYRVLNLAASPGVLPILGAVSYTVKGYPVARKPTIDGIDPKHRHSIITPACDYSLYQLCKMRIFTNFTQVTIALAIAHALKNIHAKGYLHNDLKTNNIFLNEKEELAIADYGLSTTINPEENKAYVDTLEKKLAKDPLYLDKKIDNLTTSYIAAPELPRTFYTKATDIFAYGCVLLEIATGESFFPYVVYDTNRLYHSKITEADHNAQLELILGPRCSFDCIENIIRDALNYRASNRPNLDVIIKRLSAIQSYFPKSQKVLLPHFNNISPIANLYLFHTDEWRRLFTPATPYFSSFNSSFSNWVNSVLQESSLLEGDREKYLTKARRFFEEIIPGGSKYNDLLSQRKALTSKYFLSKILTHLGESVGHVIGSKPALLYRSPPIKTPEFNIRMTYSIKTGAKTNVLIITPKNQIANERIKLRSLLPHAIGSHPSLMPCEFIFYEGKMAARSAAVTDAPDNELVADRPLELADPSRKRRRAPEESSKTEREYLSKTILIHNECPKTYAEALNSPDLLTPTNLLTWMTSLTDFVALLHENNLLLGKLEITELGINKKSQIVIKYLNGLTEKSLEVSTPASLSLFGDIISEKNDLRNLAIVMFVFVQQLTHPKPLGPEETYKMRTEQLFAISDQSELDAYIGAHLPKKSDEPNLSNILRNMIAIDPSKHISSREAHRRLLALDPMKKESFM